MNDASYHRPGSYAPEPLYQHMSTRALKPCPFCGDSATLTCFGVTAEVLCTNCNARSPVFHASNEEKAVDAWNTRACDEWRALSELADAVQMEADGEYGISGSLATALNDARAVLEWDE